ncbi:MAG TPA: hypothetical protein DCX38_06290, partial [Pseudomonas sp.]|nr:hypothetical protein [Pseudomonas sp.]
MGSNRQPRRGALWRGHDRRSGSQQPWQDQRPGHGATGIGQPNRADQGRRHGLQRRHWRADSGARAVTHQPADPTGDGG